MIKPSLRNEKKTRTMANLILISGGARSGKSSFALELTRRKYSRRVFIATAVAFDEEMRKRILQHQKERRAFFHTIEEPVDLERAVAALPLDTDVAVIDCLTVWIGNLYHHLHEDEATVRAWIERFLKALEQVSCDLILVTNEVGWGIVPENPMARSYRDTLGFLNRRIAEKAKHVYLLCCGIPLALKGGPNYGS
jgi:adenosylcobinamide kinase/adenosylcobinamide-phosphate guanylyltransferase